MRRPTALLVLLVTLFFATPTFAASRDRDFVSRFRQFVAHITRLIGGHGDVLTPPKP